MNRQRWVVALVVGALTVCGSLDRVLAQSASANGVSAKIAAAEQAVAKARAAIENGKTLVAQIPENSPYMPAVTDMLQKASESWKSAVESMNGASESAAKITDSSSEVSGEYALLAKVNADVAITGAQVVQIGLAYVEAVATNKSEALDLIQSAMKDALAAAKQVQFNYDRVKTLIYEKHSN